MPLIVCNTADIILSEPTLETKVEKKNIGSTQNASDNHRNSRRTLGKLPHDRGSQASHFNISIRQGAKMLGLTYEQFMVDFLGDHKISFINGTPSELDTEFQQEDAWLDEVLGNKT